MQLLIVGGALAAVLALANRPAQEAIRQAPNQGAQVNLNHFEPWEFREYWPKMNPDLLRKLDRFREEWGAPVVISTAGGAIGRTKGTTQHNFKRYGQVNAIDVFPKVPAGASGYQYMSSEKDRERAYRVALRVGFTGIGLYTDTTPGNMLHVDVRNNPGVATWSRVNGNYLGIEQVLA